MEKPYYTLHIPGFLVTTCCRFCAFPVPCVLVCISLFTNLSQLHPFPVLDTHLAVPVLFFIDEFSPFSTKIRYAFLIFIIQPQPKPTNWVLSQIFVLQLTERMGAVSHNCALQWFNVYCATCFGFN